MTPLSKAAKYGGLSVQVSWVFCWVALSKTSWEWGCRKHF